MVRSWLLVAAVAVAVGCVCMCVWNCYWRVRALAGVHRVDAGARRGAAAVVVLAGNKLGALPYAIERAFCIHTQKCAALDNNASEGVEEVCLRSG